MALLKNTVVQGSLRVTDSTYTVLLQTDQLQTFSQKNGITYGLGTDGQTLHSDGSKLYWGENIATRVGTTDIGSGTQPIWVDDGTLKATTYALKATVNNGTQNRLAYYSGTNAISSGNIVSEGNYISKVTYLTVNANHQTTYRFYVNGSGYFNGYVYSNRLYLNRVGATGYGRIYWYSTDTASTPYYTWITYMSSVSNGHAPTGGKPSSLGNVTAWAMRSLIESAATYGWIWEAATNAAASANTTTPTARMALSSNTGQLRIAPNASSTTNETAGLIIDSAKNASSGNVAIELWRGTYASWQIANESGTLHIRNNYTTAVQTTYTQDSITVAYNTGITTFNGTTDASSSSTGTVIVNGGVGIAKKLYVGDDIHVGNFTIGGTVDTDPGKTIASTSTIYLKTTASASVVFQTNSTSRCRVDTAGHLRPETTRTYLLGTSDYYWNGAYIHGNGNIHWNNLVKIGGQNVVTSATNRGLPRVLMGNDTNIHGRGSKLWGMSPASIKVETTSNGSTWTENTLLTDEQKRALTNGQFLNGNNSAVNGLNADAGSGNTTTLAVNYGQRITIDFTKENRYGWIECFLIYCYCRGQTCHLKFERYNIKNAAWVTIWDNDYTGNEYRVIYPSTNVYMNGNTQTTTTENYANQLRLTFTIKTLSANPQRYGPHIAFIAGWGEGIPSHSRDATYSSGRLFDMIMACHGMPLYVDTRNTGTALMPVSRLSIYGLGGFHAANSDIYADLQIGNASNANAANAHSRGRIYLYTQATTAATITSTANTDNISLNILGLTSTTANTAAYSDLVLGNSTNVNTTTAHSEGRIYIYSAATKAHVIKGRSTTTEYIHYFPNSTGWIATGGDGTSTGVGSLTKPVYLDTDGVLKGVTTTINGGSGSNRMAYYSAANTISEGPNVQYRSYNTTVTGNRTTAGTVRGLLITGNTYGNDAAYLADTNKGVFTVGDPGPQIQFGTTEGTPKAALIYTNHDSVKTTTTETLVGSSFHFVSDENPVNVVAGGFIAKTRMAVGRTHAHESWTFYVNGSGYFNNQVYVNNTTNTTVKDGSAGAIRTTGGVSIAKNLYTGAIVETPGTHIEKVQLIPARSATTTNAGWYTACKLKSIHNYGAFILQLTGGWNNTSPTVAVLDIILRNGQASISVLHNGFSGIVQQVRLIKIDNSQWYLDLYLAKTTAAESALIGNFIGNVIPYDTNTALTTSAGGTVAATADLTTIYENKIWNITKSLTITQNWLDTGIAGTNIPDSGSYIVQVFINSSTANTLTHTNTYYTGLMSWFSGTCANTNTAPEQSEIVLHSAGGDPLTHTIYLRTLGVKNGSMKLQIKGSHATTAATSITFKFQKIM